MTTTNSTEGNTMIKSKEYNGFKNYNHRNVNLYIANEYVLYKTALDAIRNNRTLDGAAREMLRALPEKTPDGVRYTFSSVRVALANLR